MPNLLLPLNKIMCADSLTYLRTLPDGCAHTIVTSPPYYVLRDYGVLGQLGSERTPAEFIAALVEIFRECHRVLRADGVLWINIGDTYANDGKFGGSSGGKNQKIVDGEQLKGSARRRISSGLPPKSMMLIPHRLAIALQDEGWILRSEIIWSKPSPMPESVKDRPSRAHEFIFMFAKSPRYYYDIDAIREPISASTAARYRYGWDGDERRDYAGGQHNNMSRFMSNEDAKRDAIEKGKNKTDVWTVASQPFKDAHFATFPPKLIEPCILAGSPEHCCSACGAPYRPVVTTRHIPQPDVSAKRNAYRGKIAEGKFAGTPRLYIRTRIEDYIPACECAAPSTPGVVLDPFMGAGTTALVALQHRRNFLGCDLNPAYIAIAERRIAPLLHQMRMF